MATTETGDLPKILELSENSRYEFIPQEGNDDGPANWRVVHSEKLTAPFLCLTFGEHMYSPQGWVIRMIPIRAIFSSLKTTQPV